VSGAFTCAAGWSAMKPPASLAARASELTERLRARSPRVHCITNAVAEAFTANVLLAAGAIPSMTINPAEVPDFLRRADALLVNLGTLDEQRQSAIEAALGVAAQTTLPWVLDPVFVERSQQRLDLAKRLIARGPAIIRANAAELGALMGREVNGDSLPAFAGSHRTVVALTGAVDRVSDGASSIAVSNGHALMARVTAMGCAASALMAAYRAVANDPLDAAGACLVHVGVAAEAAGATARGPGSFVPAYLDALDNVTPDEILARARVD
jgi:hydroxyethylthiazole kinase